MIIQNRRAKGAFLTKKVQIPLLFSFLLFNSTYNQPVTKKTKCFLAEAEGRHNNFYPSTTKKMNRKKNLICTGKTCAVHIQRHHRTYLIGTMIAVIGGALGISLMSGESAAAGGFEEKALLTFYQIEDIANKRDLNFHKIGKENFAIREANFHPLEEAFHLESDLIGKFKIAQELDSLIHWQDDYSKAKGYVSPSEESKFIALENTFDSLYNPPKNPSRTSMSNTWKQNALATFTQLFRIAKKRDEIIHALGKDNFAIWEFSYHKYADKFPTLTNIQEKYELIKELSNLLHRQDQYFQQQGYIGLDKYITKNEETLYQLVQNNFAAIQ